MILVTGGAGFIGSNLVAALCERGDRVAVCDHLGCDDKWRNVAKRDLEDLIPPERLESFLAADGRRLDAIVHLGATSSTTARDGDAVIRNNFALSKSLWEWAGAHSRPLLYASSAATYGDGTAGFDDSLDADRLAALRPLNLYGWSKHLFDRWVSHRIGTDGLRPPQWAGLKFFNVYGPNEYHKGGQTSVVYQLHGQVTRGEPARLFRSHRPDYPDGGQTRDFIWVEDCVAIMLWLLDHPDTSGLFNVGTGKARSFADLAKAVFSALGQPERIEFIPTPEAIREKYQYFTQAETGRLRAAGWSGQFTELEAGVARYLGDFLTATDPYR